MHKGDGVAPIPTFPHQPQKTSKNRAIFVPAK
jgi:hypothetical protein